MKYFEPIIIDNHFPDWMVNVVAEESKYIPVIYNNSPTANYNSARFFGNMLISDGKWSADGDVQPWWFVDYLINTIRYEICPDDNITHCRRVLLNGQAAGMKSQNHCDADFDTFLSVIYHLDGESGDTVFVNNADNDVQRVSFKRGRLILFNSILWHRGDPPDDGYRTSLGCVFPIVPPEEVPQTPFPNGLFQ